LQSQSIGGQLVHYLPLFDVLSLLLKDYTYCDGWQSQFDANNDMIEHPCNTDGWHELQLYFEQKFPLNQQVFLTLFIDEYNQSKLSRQKVNSILFTIANAKQEVIRDSDLILELTVFFRFSYRQHENTFYRACLKEWTSMKCLNM
jgi:hypothetical protein